MNLKKVVLTAISAMALSAAAFADKDGGTKASGSSGNTSAPGSSSATGGSSAKDSDNSSATGDKGKGGPASGTLAGPRTTESSGSSDASGSANDSAKTHKKYSKKKRPGSDSSGNTQSHDNSPQPHGDSPK